MSTQQKLTSEEINTTIASHPAWAMKEDGHIEREFVFNTFPEAFSFMTRVALEAERLDHHPEWSNSFNKVKIGLTTHSAGGLTNKDIELLRKIEQINWS